ncbi:hypothetical protein [Rhodopirellula sp. MGV]|uniref:hypothetical protein n=1 Tax=Rhodopirellula sp. MGV TaxID=2023130 RepID=UPI00117A695D|nr:hypothetical protein [Rhodopirellula sp. MGV]
MRSLSQSFFAPGKTYEVHIADAVDGQEIRELRFSDPAIHADVLRNGDQPIDNHFQVAIGPDVPAGRYEVRAVGRFGLSNPRSIVVDQRVENLSSDAGARHNPVAIKPGTIYALEARAAQRFHATLTVEAGKLYHLRLIADAVDSKLIGRVAVVDPNGHLIESRFGSDRADTVFDFVSPASGTATVTLGDALFRGGVAFQGGLLIREGGDAEAEYLHQNRMPRSLKIAETDVPWGADDATEPQTVPFQIEGTFDLSQQRESHLVRFEKGVPVSISVVSDRAAQPTDVRLIVQQQVTQSDGAVQWNSIATADDGPNVGDAIVRLTSKDPQLRFDPPAEGVYRIVVWDQDNGNALGTRQSYRLVVRPAYEDFRLVAYHLLPSKDLNQSRASGIYLPRGGSETIRVFAIRHGTPHPITVRVTGLPDDLRCTPGVIAANQSYVDLTLTAAIDAMPADVELQISGTGEVDVNDHSGIADRPAAAASMIWAPDTARTRSTVRLCDALRIQVSDFDRCPITVTTDESPLPIKKGTKSEAKIIVTRAEGNASSIVLRAKNLPPGVKVADLTIAADKNEAQWVIEVTDQATPGTYTFWGQAESKVKFATNPQLLERAKTKVNDLKLQLESATDPTVQESLNQQIKKAEEHVQSVAAQVAPKDITLYLPSSLITVVIE